MEKIAWTKRGEINEYDKSVIRSFTENDKIASRIFVTGEVHEHYIGDAAYRTLVNSNQLYYTEGWMQEPLFVDTKNETVRMVRFDPNVVWRCFHPDILVELFTAEIKRLGVNMDAWKMDHFDFYESMIAAIKAEKGDFIIPLIQKGADLDFYYNAVYLSCLLLFGKPGYMDIPVAQHFASPSVEAQLKYAEYRTLNVVQQKEVENLRKQYGGIQSLTNPELLFIVGLYAEEKKHGREGAV